MIVLSLPSADASVKMNSAISARLIAVPAAMPQTLFCNLAVHVHVQTKGGSYSYTEQIKAIYIYI